MVSTKCHTHRNKVRAWCTNVVQKLQFNVKNEMKFIEKNFLSELMATLGKDSTVRIHTCVWVCVRARVCSRVPVADTGKLRRIH